MGKINASDKIVSKNQKRRKYIYDLYSTLQSAKYNTKEEGTDRHMEVKEIFT